MSSATDTTTGGRDEIIAALISNVVIGCVAIFAFSFLRRRLTWLYDIRRVDHARNFGHRPGDAFLERPPQQPRSFFGWIPAIYNITESTMLKTAGLDAVIVLRYFKHMIFYFVYMCVLAWCVIVPVTISGETVDTVIGINIFSMANIPEKSHRFIAHLCVTWVFTFFLFYILYKQWKENIVLHSKWSSSEQLMGRQLTIFVEHIPEQYLSDEKFNRLANNLFPGNIASAQLLRDTGKVGKLAKRRDELILTINNLRGMQELDYKTDHAAPHHNVKCCRKSTRVESIPYYLQELDKVCTELEQLLKEAQDNEEKQTKLIPYKSCGFITFNSVMPYSAASIIPLTSQPGNLLARPAPEPRDLVWFGLLISPLYRLIMGWLMNVATFFLVFFYTIPVGFIASITTLEYLSEKIPFLEPVLDWQPALRAWLQGFLPGLATIIFMALLPKILLGMAHLQGVEAHSWISILVMKRYFIFQLFNFFLISCLSSAVFQQIREVIDHPSTIVSLLATSLPGSALGFITYIMIRGFSDNLMSLLSPPSIVIKSIKWFFAGTPAEYLKAWDPEPFSIGKLLPESTLIGIVGFAFGVIQPIILPFVAFYFFTLYFVQKYNLAYTNVTPFETGGKFFPLITNRLLFGIGIAQLTIIGVVGLKRVPIESALIAPLPFLTFTFFYYTNKYLQPLYDFTSITGAIRSDYARSQLTDDERKALAAGVAMESIAEGIMPVLMTHVYGDSVAKDEQIRALLSDGKITPNQAEELWESYGMFPDREAKRRAFQTEFYERFERNFAEKADGVFGLFELHPETSTPDLLCPDEVVSIDTKALQTNSDTMPDTTSPDDVELNNLTPMKDTNDVISLLHNNALVPVGGEVLNSIDDVEKKTSSIPGPSGGRSTDPKNLSISIKNTPTSGIQDLGSPSAKVNTLVNALSPRSYLTQNFNFQVACARYIQQEMAPEYFAPKLLDSIWPQIYIRYYILKKTKGKKDGQAVIQARRSSTLGEQKSPSPLSPKPPLPRQPEAFTNAPSPSTIPEENQANISNSDAQSSLQIHYHHSPEERSIDRDATDD